MTASRALHRPDLVAEETRLRVEAAVEQTGYVPNSLAGGLTSRQTRLVAAIVPSVGHSLFSDMLDELVGVLEATRLIRSMWWSVFPRRMPDERPIGI
jgi:LacI family gluconate utilization system Gnt-I transcriptional repressor